MRFELRFVYLFVFLACASLLGYAFYLQHYEHLLPCPLCVAQRIAYWLLGFTALLAFLHNPAPRIRRWYGGVMAGLSLAGAAVALHQAWIIRHPTDAGCSISPEEKFLNALPMAKWWPGMFEANGDCTVVTWKFLSFAMADWSLVWFVFFFGLAAYLLVTGRSAR